MSRAIKGIAIIPMEKEKLFPDTNVRYIKVFERI
jgi:hypothetical protein